MPVSLSTLPRLLPRGRLAATDWRDRHRLVCAVLGLHLIGLLSYLALAEHPASSGAAATVAVALGLGVALTPVNRRVRALAATAGLLSSSTALVELGHASPILHAHYVFAVALTTVYEDWATYVLGLVFVLVAHLFLAGTDVRPGHFTLVDLVLVAAAGLTQLVLWAFADESWERDEGFRRDLAELDQGHRVVEDRLRQLDATREDLLATVSHEFRTPLTAIQGAALTMRKHRARLATARVDEMLDAVVVNTERLGRLLENMLAAAEARTPDQSAVTDVHQVATEVAQLVEAAHVNRAPTVVVAVDEGLEARVEGPALHQILANLLDNAIVSGAVEKGDVVVTVANEADGVDAQMLAELFEPFTQRDSSSTRAHEGAGVGLYVVRRLVEVSSGSLSVRSQPGWVSVEVRLPRAEGPLTVDLTETERIAGR